MNRLNRPKKVWSLGDSWCAGYGLSDTEQRFGDVLAKHYWSHHVNLGVIGSSLGKILHTFVERSFEINKDDLVVVIVPPDIRWYTILSNDECQSFILGHKGYSEFLKDKTPDWFIYHHSLFIYTFISICESIGCQIVLAHNYGQLIIDKKFKHLIDADYFLDKEKCLTELLGGNPWRDNYSTSLCQDEPDIAKGENFIPNDNHPSEKGHRKIAEFIIKKLEG